jgi:hypothetical protein
MYALLSAGPLTQILRLLAINIRQLIHCVINSHLNVRLPIKAVIIKNITPLLDARAVNAFARGTFNSLQAAPVHG